LGFDWTEKGNGLGIRVSKFTSYTNFLMYLFCRAREKQAGRQFYDRLLLSVDVHNSLLLVAGK
jgi:hypothetical protein